MRIIHQRHIAFGRMRHIGVARHIRNRRRGAGQEVAAAQLAVHDLQQGMRARQGGVRVVGRAKHRDQARRRRAVGQGPRRDRQPTLHGGRTHGVAGQPGLATIARGQVNQDGVRIGHHGAVVVNHRHLAERIERQEVRTLVFTAAQVDVNTLMRHVQQRQHQGNAMRVAGQGKAIEDQRGGGHGDFLGG
ncbi:hypothetical protein D3C73_1057200 [compost metagenome]